MNDTRFAASELQAGAAGSVYGSIWTDLAAREFSPGFLDSIGVEHVTNSGGLLGGWVAARLTKEHRALKCWGRWKNADTFNRPHLDFLRAAHEDRPLG